MVSVNTREDPAPSSQPIESEFPLSMRISRFFARLIEAFMNLFEIVFTPLQRLLGTEKMGYLFVLPNLLIFGIFVLFPMGLNFYYALTGGSRVMPADRAFVGTENFERLFECGNYLDPNSCTEDFFWRGLYNTTFFVVFQVAGIVLFALITALILNRNIRFRGFFRSVFFYPVLLSPVVVGLIWKWILQRQGLLNAILQWMGVAPIGFLQSSNWATFWVIVVSVWAQMGFFTLILLAGLQAIPKELYEAGDIDGANNWQSFWGITLPLLMPTMFVVLVLALIRAVQVFDQVYVLTAGGPGTATRYMVQYIYEIGFAASVKQFGMAAAASVVLGVGLLTLTLIQLRVGQNSELAD